MATSHRGNLLNEITFEEHDGANNAKRVNVVSGTITASSQVTVQPLAAWPDPKTFIGLTTVNIGSSNATLFAVVNTAAAGQASVVLDTGTSYIGLATVTVGAPLPTGANFIGLATVRGSVLLGGAANYVGLMTIDIGSNNNVAIRGNVTLSDSKTFIGLATVMNAYGSGSTVYTGVISSTGNTTVLVAPASNRFFIKNLHVSSLGRAELEIRSGATTLIPFTSLSTTAGFFEHFGEMGLPARAQQDALVFNLNGGATISYMANVRFEV